MAFRQTISFTDPQAEWLKYEAEMLGITFADTVRRIIDQWRIRQINIASIAGPPYSAGPEGLPPGPVAYKHFERPVIPWDQLRWSAQYPGYIIVPKEKEPKS